MISSEFFIKTHIDSELRAEVLRSLSVAADLVIQGQGMTDKELRTNIGLHIIDAIRFLSEDLANTTRLIVDAEESRVLYMKSKL